MVDLVAAEGDIPGAPLTDEERRILASDSAMSDELAAKARSLIDCVLDKQVEDDRSRSPQLRQRRAWLGPLIPHGQI